jgi:hypothetical protein
MRHTRGEGALVVALLAWAWACADPASRIVAPSSSKDIASETAPAPSAERAALTKIARLVAVAMDNEPARQHLKRDMRAAPFREHKLELASYLRSKDRKALLGRMAAINGADEAAIFTTLAATQPLEFYMPVAKQRETWKERKSCSSSHNSINGRQSLRSTSQGKRSLSTEGLPRHNRRCRSCRWRLASTSRWIRPARGMSAMKTVKQLALLKRRRSDRRR